MEDTISDFDHAGGSENDQGRLGTGAGDGWPWYLEEDALDKNIRMRPDPDDEFELYNEGVAFYGVPGASGWADGIGDVAVHYMGARWAVFSKIFPFSEQGAAREAHEDVLLLGTAKHVMLTPHCAYRIGERATDRPTPPPARQHAPSHAHACPFPCP